MKKIIKSNNILTLFIVIISFVMMTGSLYISEVMLIEACKWCWSIRVCLFPLFPISLYAYMTRKFDIYPLYIIFSSIGFMFSSIYWYKTQFSPSSLRCGLTGEVGVSCLENAVKIIGFVNLPFLGMIVSILVIILALLIRKNNK